MRAMVLEQWSGVETNPLSPMEVPRPAPDAREVLIRVHYCGVCRTDLHVIEAELAKKKVPLIPGHQIVGRIEAVGAQVKRLKRADAVGTAWVNQSCAECSYCRSHQENLCDRPLFTGYDVPGGYAEYVTVPEDYAFLLPPALDMKTSAPLLCAGIIGYRAMKRAHIPPGGSLGLFGFGSSAHLALQLATALGYQVYVVSRADGHRSLADKMGAKAVVSNAFELPRKLDSAILFAPAGEIVPQALTSLKKGGTLALAGIHMSAIPALDYEKHLFYEKNLCSVTSYTRQDATEYLEAAVKHKITAHVTHFPLEKANEALRALKTDQIQGSAVLSLV